MIEELNPLLGGWVAYFGLNEVKGVLGEPDGWIRHKLRRCRGGSGSVLIDGHKT